MNKKGYLYLSVGLLIVLIIPILINIICGRSQLSWYTTIGAPSDWLAFWGSYLGAIIALFALAVTVFVTQKENTKTLNYNREMTWLEDFTKQAGHFTSFFINGLEKHLNILKNLSIAEKVYGKTLRGIREDLNLYLDELNNAISNFILFLPTEEEGDYERELNRAFFQTVNDARCIVIDSLWLLNGYITPNYVLKPSIAAHLKSESKEPCTVKRIWSILEEYEPQQVMLRDNYRDKLFSELCGQISPSVFYKNLDTFIKYKKSCLRPTSEKASNAENRLLGRSVDLAKSTINANWIYSMAQLTEKNHDDSVIVRLSKKSHIITRVMTLGSGESIRVNKKETISFIMLSGEISVNLMTANNETISIPISYNGPNIGFVVPEKTPYWVSCKSSKAVFIEMMNERL